MNTNFLKIYIKNKTNTYVQVLLTISAIYGETMPPTRANAELEPMPAFLTTVGNISADHT
jgi:hypothetical protein